MNELVWEGLLEILRDGEPSLKASAHLWRRDDHNGSDWGGQLELPVVFRRLLPAEEYKVRLPSGAEARVRVAAGPSTTTMTFPTLTGIGHPPFGGAATVITGDTEADAEPERAAPSPRRSASETPRTPRERATRSTEAPPRLQRAASTTREAAVAGPPAASTSEARATAAPRLAPAPPEPAPAAPEPESAPEAPVLTEPTHLAESKAAVRAARTTTRGRTARHGAGRSRDSEGESVEQTEALARAFLAAVEARQAILPLERGGFEGRAIASTREDIEAIAGILEGALRTPDGSAGWIDELQGRLTVIGWFASLAVPDEQSDVAAAGQTALVLLHTLEGLLAINVEQVGGSAAVPRAA